MAQYIDKDALVEYIEQRYMEHQTGNRPIGCLDRMDEDKVILSFVNTLEVKEVDLNTDFGVCWGEYCDCGGNINDYKIAKHFFELGLKAKGE